MKVIFLDFDGVMDTAYYGHVLGKEGLPYHDEFGAVFDPNCVGYLKKIIEKTGAEIVVFHSLCRAFIKYFLPLHQNQKHHGRIYQYWQCWIPKC